MHEATPNDPRAPWPQLSPAEREREYSPSSCLGGDWRPYLEAYRRTSAEARAGAEAIGAPWTHRRLGDAPRPAVDLCLPPATAPRPCPLLVFIHGGYWQELSAAESSWPAATCAQRGVAFAAIDYTLAPQATVAAIVAECREAMAWLLGQAPALGVDPGRVVVAGSSAGAHLAAMVSLAGALPEGRQPHAAVLVSGIYWLEPLIGTTINDALGLDAAAAHQASPGRAPLAGFPEAAVCWGEIETAAFKTQSGRFAAALTAAGARCAAFEVAGRNHFDVALDLVDPATPLGRRTLALLGVG
jgi:arylformamidase